MGKVVAGMMVSLDGFVNDRNGEVSRLYPDMAALGASEVLQKSIRTTGAVVMGRATYDMGQGDYSGYEFQMPIFVLTHHSPEKPAKGENEKLTFHFVSEGVESAVAQAKRAAGNKNVTVVGGPKVIRQLLRAALVDELQIDIAPVLLGGGTRLFDDQEPEATTLAPIVLEQIAISTYLGITHLAFRVIKE
jgi:dihydrofolate reductase